MAGLLLALDNDWQVGEKGYRSKQRGGYRRWVGKEGKM